MNYVMEQKTKIVEGMGAVSLVGDILKDSGYFNAFIVYDSGVKKAGIVEKVIASIEKYNIKYTEFDKVVSDPPAYVVNEGGNICCESGCDCVIAIGGGSAIDTGKGINILRVNGGDILKYQNPDTAMKKCNGLISIPTTSGTGSELSNGLIISDTEKSMKAAILAENAMSEYAVLDPELTAGMPKGLTMMTGLDAFSHAAEGYTSILSNDLSDMICEKIMETVVEYLPRAVEHGEDMEARTKMQIASSMGGWMLANASAHVGHSIAHVIGGRYHISHGACCAYSLPVVLRFIADKCPDKIKKIGDILGADFSEDDGFESITEKTTKAYIKFRDEILGLNPITDYDLGEKDFDNLAEAVVNEPLAGLTLKKVDYDSAKKMLIDIVL